MFVFDQLEKAAISGCLTVWLLPLAMKCYFGAYLKLSIGQNGINLPGELLTLSDIDVQRFGSNIATEFSLHSFIGLEVGALSCLASLPGSSDCCEETLFPAQV